MPVVFPVLVPLLVILSAFAVLALHATTNLWLRPMLDGLANPQGSFLKRVAMAPAATLLKGVLWIEKHTRSLLSHAAAAQLPVATAWLNAQAHRVAAQAREQAALAVATAEALGVLRHHTIPRLIRARVAPVAAAAAAAGALSRRSISEGKTLRIRTGRSIDRLNRKMGLLAGILLGIDVLVRGRHAHRHHTDHARDLPRIRDRDIPRLKTADKSHGAAIRRHSARLRRIEEILAGVIGGLVVYRVLAKVAPWLFCRNWKKFGRGVCGMHAGLLDFLLGAGAGMFAFAELCRIIELIGAIAARVLPKLIAPLAVAGAALCDGEHSAAAPLPLQTTALPSVDTPLTF